MVDRDLPIDLARIWLGHGWDAVWNYVPAPLEPAEPEPEVIEEHVTESAPALPATPAVPPG
ncbi:hypothetical protein [Streptomyces sp. NPDC001820]|uniref:hypothetical protein n=1 Tax=Streptomyces sp. NPDC001820 TaxID=3364613 RepID=UPI0036805385